MLSSFLKGEPMDKRLFEGQPKVGQLVLRMGGAVHTLTDTGATG